MLPNNNSLILLLLALEADCLCDAWRGALRQFLRQTAQALNNWSAHPTSRDILKGTGETSFNAGAEGATAPETLRPKDRRQSSSGEKRAARSVRRRNNVLRHKRQMGRKVLHVNRTLQVLVLFHPRHHF